MVHYQRAGVDGAVVDVNKMCATCSVLPVLLGAKSGSIIIPQMQLASVSTSQVSGYIRSRFDHIRQSGANRWLCIGDNGKVSCRSNKRRDGLPYDSNC